MGLSENDFGFLFLFGRVLLIVWYGTNDDPSAVLNWLRPGDSPMIVDSGSRIALDCRVELVNGVCMVVALLNSR